MIRYLWPLWAWLAFQLIWNTAVMIPFHGYRSPFGDWVYGRNCGWGMCDGIKFVVTIAAAFAILFVGNIAFQKFRGRV